MARSNKTAGITLLFDSFSTESQNLYNSFITSKIDCNTVVINDDGFLPDGVLSLYQYFLGTDKGSGKAKYFNEIPVPDYWEISGTNNNGQIHNLGKLKARLFFANPTFKRLVRAVEWFDSNNVVRFCDYYNKRGILYARATFDKEQKIILKSYFDSKGKEIIVEDFVTDDIILNYKGKVIIFHSKTEFVLFYLKTRGFDKTRVFINSLGIPFFVSNDLGKDVPVKEDVLFWQEYTRDDVPGNMQYIFEGKASRINKIYVQKKDSYDRLIKLGVPTDIVKRKGYVYPFKRDTRFNKEALILTNSDKIDHITEIISECPFIHFHIAALTEMSAKLMSLGKYDNITLYPTVTTDIVDSLYGKCDIYLDINRENEILNAINRAFLNNQLILAFNETLHNINYVAKKNRFKSEKYSSLIDTLKGACEDFDMWDDLLKEQTEYALTERPESYYEIVGV